MERILKKIKIKKGDIKELILDVIYMTFGAYILSLGIKVFLLPFKLSTGGASGIATIIYYLYNIPMGITVLAINIPLFIIALLKLGVKFSIKSIYTTVMLSVFLDAFNYTSILNIMNIDLFISSVFGGILVGFGISIIFKSGSSSGGSDLLAQIIYNLTSIQSLSQLLLIIDTCIILAIVIVFKDINLGLYSIVAIFISKKVIDIVFEGIYYTKVVSVISSKYKIIARDIKIYMQRGVTYSKVFGAFTENEYGQLLVILTMPEIYRLKRIVKKHDKGSLVYIVNAHEVLGNGFKEI